MPVATGSGAIQPASRIAVITGDPSKPGPFVLRAQVPAGYRIAPHWHPTDENLTVLPAEMRHFFMARTASTFQVHGMGPFAVNYVNPADDPRQKK